jgi:hypothetical protein
MNAGNWTVFNVTNGSTYEWTYCSQFGGSQSWNTELTLFNNSTNSVLCYQNNSGLSSCPNAAYLRWTANFTGTVKLLTSMASCQSNTGTPYSKLVWRRASAGCTPVSIQNQPQNQSQTTGNTVTFTVTPAGSAPFLYFWYHNGSQISGATSQSYTTPPLTISNNGDTYYCIVTNCSSNSQAVSNQALLTVTSAGPCNTASFTSQPSNLSVPLNGMGTFSITATGSNISYRWQVSTTVTPSWTNLSNGGNYSGSSTASLTISNASTSMNGNKYRCSISNSCTPAQTSTERTLTVTGTGCSTSLNPSSVTFPAIGGTGSLNIDIAPNSCAWSASTASTWIHLTSATSGTGDVALTYLLDANVSTASRTGSIVVNGQVCSISQSGTSSSVYTLTGKVKDVGINIATRSLIQSDYANCIVTAYHAGTSTVAGTAVTNGSGTYLILLPSSGAYDIKATDASTPVNSVKITNINTNSVIPDIKIPATVIRDLVKEKNHLVNLRPTLSSIPVTNIPSYSYNVADQNSLLSQWRNIGSDYDRIIESAARLYLADSVFHMFYQNADFLNDEAAISFYEVSKSVVTNLTLLKKVREILTLNGNALARRIVEDFMDQAYRRIYNKLDEWISTQSWENYTLKVAVLAALDRLRHENFPTAGLTFEVLKPIMQDIYASQIIQHEYIQFTNPTLANETLKARDFSYTGTFSTHFVLTMQSSVRAWQNAQQAKIESQLHRDRSNIISSNSALIGMTGTAAIFALPELAAICRAIAIGGEFWSITELTKAYFTARQGFVNNRTELVPAANMAFRTSGFQGARIQTTLSTLDSIIDVYNRQLSDISPELLNANADAVKKIDSITLSEKALQNAIRTAMIPLISTASAAHGTLPWLDSLLLNHFTVTVDYQPWASTRFQYCELSYLLEPQHTVTKDSLVSFASALKLQNSGIHQEFLSAYDSIQRLPAVNYIYNLESTIPVSVKFGDSKTSTVRFANWGPDTCRNLFAKIVFDSSFSVSTDSVYIGTLAPGQADSLSFVINAPVDDTSVNYHISFYAPNTIGEDFIGSIKARPLPDQPLLQYNSKICYGDTLKLEVINDYPDAEYYWTGPNGFTSFAKKPVIAGMSSVKVGIYTCYVVSEGLKSTIANLSVLVNQPHVLIRGRSRFCANEPPTLTASGANLYSWNNGQNSASIVINTGGVYSVIGKNLNGCADTAYFTATMLPLPTFNLLDTTIVNIGQPARLGGNPTVLGNGPFRYKWSPSLRIDWDTVPNPVSTTPFNIDYLLTVTDKNGCKDQKVTHVIVQGIYLFPNPTQNILKIYGSRLPHGNYALSLTNPMGQVIWKEMKKNYTDAFYWELDMRRFAAGNYVLSVSTGKESYSFKVIKK